AGDIEDAPAAGDSGGAQQVRDEMYGQALPAGLVARRGSLPSLVLESPEIVARLHRLTLGMSPACRAGGARPAPGRDGGSGTRSRADAPARRAGSRAAARRPSRRRRGAP